MTPFGPGYEPVILREDVDERVHELCARSRDEDNKYARLAILAEAFGTAGFSFMGPQILDIDSATFYKRKVDTLA